MPISCLTASLVLPLSLIRLFVSSSPNRYYASIFEQVMQSQCKALSLFIVLRPCSSWRPYFQTSVFSISNFAQLSRCKKRIVLDFNDLDRILINFRRSTPFPPISSFSTAVRSQEDIISSQTSGASDNVSTNDNLSTSHSNLDFHKLKHSLSDVFVVDTPDAAEHAVRILELNKDQPHAWDTETVGIDPSKENIFTGVGSRVSKEKKSAPSESNVAPKKIRVVCATAFLGDHVEFDKGKPKLFVDNLQLYNNTPFLKAYFKDYFQCSQFKKIWHNYSFDRHALCRNGILCQGLAADTIHMARLFDSSRFSYSLESLSKDLLLRQEEAPADQVQFIATDKKRKSSSSKDESSKSSIKKLFSVPIKRKDGTDGSRSILLPSDEIQNSSLHIRNWIHYSTLDAKVTYLLYEFLRTNLESQIFTRHDGSKGNMLQLYEEVYIPFAECLTDMERLGFKIDIAHIKKCQKAAEKQKDELIAEFKKWAVTVSPGAEHLNVHSDKQKQYFFFAPYKDSKKNIVLEREKEFLIEANNNLENKCESNSDESTDEPGLSLSEKYAVMLNEDTEEIISVEQCQDENNTAIEASKPKKKTLKYFTIVGQGFPASLKTVRGYPSVSGAALTELAGKPIKSDDQNVVYDGVAFKKGGAAACKAIASLLEALTITKLLNTFIEPMPELVDHYHRVHASLNLNTETGRLSCRRPNLQNQPALEKDIFKIRSAFTCEEGNMLIVADYGQLELRLLAHITKCKSMIDAFNGGGDYHSRTAVTMYPYIQQAINNGEVMLEGDGEKTVKNIYGTERRRAKTLNFAIAYGMSAKSLAKDWNVDVKTAEETVEAWYRERQEVKSWQERSIKRAKECGYVETILGRRRILPGINSISFKERGHQERAAINTPLQGSAADIVTMAMVRCHRNQRLNELGWKMILQIHDELILEGPKEHVEEAAELVRNMMQNPFGEGYPFLVDLVVDLKHAKTWYDAK